jgi:hypothetical protein
VAIKSSRFVLEFVQSGGNFKILFSLSEYYLLFLNLIKCCLVFPFHTNNSVGRRLTGSLNPADFAP